MPNYIFTYHQPADYVPGADGEAIAAWQSYFEGIQGRVVDAGQPVFARTSVGDTGPGTKLGGYSVVTADSLEDAIGLAHGCPTMSRGGGVEVGELADLPPDHIAARLRAQKATA